MTITAALQLASQNFDYLSDILSAKDEELALFRKSLPLVDMYTLQSNTFHATSKKAANEYGTVQQKLPKERGVFKLNNLFSYQRSNLFF
jgi:hypothetical protein